MKQQPIENWHDIIAFGSMIVLVLLPGLGGLWFSSRFAMTLLGLEIGSRLSILEFLVLLGGIVVGFTLGMLLGSVLWLLIISRYLPLQTVRKWVLGDTTGRVRQYIERLLQHFTASS